MRGVRLSACYTFTYLERFFRNLLLGEQWVLKSRYLFVNPPAEYRDQPRQRYQLTVKGRMLYNELTKPE